MMNQKLTNFRGAIRFAFSNGSLEDAQMKLFMEASFPVVRYSRRHDILIDDPLFSLTSLMRPQHVPPCVQNGSYHMGICGLDCCVEACGEKGRSMVIAELTIGRNGSTGAAKVVLVCAENNPIQKITDIPVGTVILSEYPNSTRRFFKRLGIPVGVQFSYGGTEAHIPRDYQFGVCLTETGSSLKANGLRIFMEIMETKTVLIRSPLSVLRREGKGIMDSITLLTHVLLGTFEARVSTFIVMNVPIGKQGAVLKQLPALKAPTVTPLAGGKYVSIGTVVRKSELNRLTELLLKNGARDLVQMPISNVIQRW